MSDPPTEPVSALDSADAGGQALRGGVLRSAGYAAGFALALISAPLLIRHLGEAEYGRYANVLALLAVVGGLTEAGVTTVALRELAHADDRMARDRLLGDLLGLRLVTSTVALGLAMVYAVLVYDVPLIWGTLLAGIGILLAQVQTLLSAVLQTQLRFGWATAIDLGRQALTVALLVALVLTGGSTVTLLATLIPTAGLAVLATGLLVRRTTALRPAFHPNRWGPLLRDTAVFAVAVAMASLYFRIPALVLFLVSSELETGYFSISLRIVEVLIGVPGLLIGAVFPLLARAAAHDPVRFEQAMRRTFELALLAGCAVCVPLVLGAPFLIDVLAGESGEPAARVLQLQAGAVLASFVSATAGYGLMALRRHRELVVCNTVALGVALALTLALAPSFGADGAAGAALAGEAGLAATSTWLLVRRDGPRLPLGAVPGMLLLAAAALGLGLLAGVHPIVQATVGVAVFLVGLVVTGRFPPEVREILQRKATRADATS